MTTTTLRNVAKEMIREAQLKHMHRGPVDGEHREEQRGDGAIDGEHREVEGR